MAGVNPIARKVATNAVISNIVNAVTPSLSFNEGDLLIWDSSNHVVAKAVAESEGITFIGVAVVTIVNGLLPASYVTSVDASLATPAISGPQFGDEYHVILTAGQTITTGSPVYLDPVTGTRNVQSSGTKIVGIYTGAQGASVTAATGGTVIYCKLGARYPGDTLKF